MKETEQPSYSRNYRNIWIEDAGMDGLGLVMGFVPDTRFLLLWLDVNMGGHLCLFVVVWFLFTFFLHVQLTCSFEFTVTQIFFALSVCWKQRPRGIFPVCRLVWPAWLFLAVWEPLIQ